MLPRVHRVRRGGTVYKYHRRTRKELPRDMPEDDPRFVAAWLAEEQRAPSVRSRSQAGTIAAACEAYLGSRSYRELSDGYRPVIRRHVERIKEQGEKALLKDLLPRHIRADLEPLSPPVASSRLKAWRKLAEFWLLKGMLDADPSEGVKRKKMGKVAGFTEWTGEDLEAFRARWPIGTAQRLALELYQWTGARCVDVIRLGPQMVGRDGVLTYVQQKTGNPAHVPWTCPAFGLEEQRADLMRCLSGGSPVYMLTEYGKPRTQKGVSQWFSAAAREAGLAGRTAHGLRKYRMNALAEHGASVLVMQSWVGHTTLLEVQEYTRRADRRRVISGGQPVKRDPAGA